MNNAIKRALLVLVATTAVIIIALLSWDNTTAEISEPATLTIYRPELDVPQKQDEVERDRILRNEALAVINRLFIPNTVEIVYVNATAAFIEIRLNNRDIFMGDAGCAAFGDLCYGLCQLDSGDVILHVEGGAPSVVNPMDIKWAHELAESNGSPAPADEYDTESIQSRILNALLQRGIIPIERAKERVQPAPPPYSSPAAGSETGEA